MQEAWKIFCVGISQSSAKPLYLLLIFGDAKYFAQYGRQKLGGAKQDNFHDVAPTFRWSYTARAVYTALSVYDDWCNLVWGINIFASGKRLSHLSYQWL